MRRLFALPAAVLALAFGLGSVTPVAAQDAAGPPTVGTEIEYTDEETGVQGLVTVSEVADPFEDFDPNYPPEAGTRFVMLTVAFENTGQTPFPADPYAVRIMDTDGYAWQRQSVTRPAEAVIPELESQTMAPGNRISGVIPFVLPAEAEIDQILYQPVSSRIITLADLRPEAGPQAGTEVAYTDQEGAEGLVTVSEVADPFEDFDPNSPPQAGSRYVVLTVAFENAGQTPLEVSPGNLILRDADGFLWGTTSVPRGQDVVIPELESQTMAPGNRISGVVGFNPPADAELTEIYYQPESGRLLLLADLRPAAGPTGTPAGTPGTGTTTTADCAALQAWLTASVELANQAFLVSGTMVAMRSAGGAEYEQLLSVAPGAFAQAAEEQRASNPPAEVADLNERLAAAYDGFANGYQQLLDAETAGDQAAIDAAGQVLFDAEPAFFSARNDLNELAESCGIATDPQ